MQRLRNKSLPKDTYKVLNLYKKKQQTNIEGKDTRHNFEGSMGMADYMALANRKDKK